MSSSEEDIDYVPVKISRKRPKPLDASVVMKMTERIYNPNINEKLQKMDPEKLREICKLQAELDETEGAQQQLETRNFEQAQYNNDIARLDDLSGMSDEEKDKFADRPLTPPPTEYIKNCRKSRCAAKKKTIELYNKLQKVISSAEAVPEVVDNDDSILDDDDCVIVEDEANRVSIEVNFRLKKYHYIMPVNRPFLHLYELLAKDVKVDQERLHISSSDGKVLHSDTPESLGERVHEILECVETKRNLPTIKIHLQSSGLRSRRTYQVVTCDSLRPTLQKYAREQLNRDTLDELRFRFDDEPLDIDATPQQAELEDGMCIDVIECRTI